MIEILELFSEWLREPLKFYQHAKEDYKMLQMLSAKGMLLAKVGLLCCHMTPVYSATWNISCQCVCAVSCGHNWINSRFPDWQNNTKQKNKNHFLKFTFQKPKSRKIFKKITEIMIQKGKELFKIKWFTWTTRNLIPFEDV